MCVVRTAPVRENKAVPSDDPLLNSFLGEHLLLFGRNPAVRAANAGIWVGSGRKKSLGQPGLPGPPPHPRPLQLLLPVLELGKLTSLMR